MHFLLLIAYYYSFTSWITWRIGVCMLTADWNEEIDIACEGTEGKWRV